MRLISFRIKNFKSIIDTGECSLSKNDNILVLAGQNETGKSAIIEALNFFGNGPTEDFGRLNRRKEEHPEVVCKFSLNDEDIENIFYETQNENLKDYLKEKPVLRFVRGSVDEDAFEEICLTSENLEELNSFFQERTTEEEKEVSETKDDTQSDQGEKEPTIKSVESLEEFLINEIRDFIFYNTFTDQLPGIVTISGIEKYPAVLDFEKVFNVDFKELIKKDARGISRIEIKLNREASDDLNTYWSQKLEEESRYNFRIKVETQEPKVNTRIYFMIDRDDGEPLYMEQKSKGFRWFSAFNLRLRAFGVEEATIKNLVILIDEPGQGLHEKAQRDVKKIIEELGEKGAQIIYATHYPNLIGTEGREFARIRLISNTKALGTKVETVAQFAARADQGAKDALSPIITAMGIQSIQSLFDINRRNVVVEGISDHYYLSAFKKLLNKDERLYFLPACGVNNIPNLVSVLIGWGCNYKAVFDDDSGSGRKAYNLLKKHFYEGDDDLAHEHILKIKGCNGIEDVFGVRDFYKFVLNESFPQNGSKAENSKLAKGRKELLARLFLERVERDEVELTQVSEKKIEKIFDWIYEKFNIKG